jgi:hypothetical protein
LGNSVSCSESLPVFSQFECLILGGSLGKEDVGRHTAPGALRTDGWTDRKRAGFTDTDRTSDCYKDYYISRGPIMGIEYSLYLRFLQCWPIDYINGYRAIHRVNCFYWIVCKEQKPLQEKRGSYGRYPLKHHYIRTLYLLQTAYALSMRHNSRHERRRMRGQGPSDFNMASSIVAWLWVSVSILGPIVVGFMVPYKIT